MYPNPTDNYKADSARVAPILNQYSNLNFVKRILTPNQYPILPLPGEDNHFATHKMAYAEVDGKHIVYPTIIYNPQSNRLQELGGKAAIQHALQNNEYIPFDQETDADWFSKNYKAYWGASRQPNMTR